MSKLLPISLLLSSCAFAQGGPAAHVISGPSLPAKCSPKSGDIWFLTTNTPTGALYTCTAKNTWTASSGGSGCTPSGTVNSVLLDNGSGACSSSTVTISSGNISAPGTVSAGVGSGTNGAVDLLNGAGAAAQAANTFRLTTPASIGTAYTWKVPAADASGYVKSDGSGNLSIGAAGGSVFTGSTAVTSSFSATPTFSLADVSIKSPVRFEPAALSANVTAVTFSNKTAGAKFSIVWLQDGTGSRTVTYGASVTSGTTCTISPTLSLFTEQFFEVAADGTTVNGAGCVSNDTILRVQSELVTPTADATSGIFTVSNSAGTVQVISADTTNARIGIGTNTPARTLHTRGAQNSLRMDRGDGSPPSLLLVEYPDTTYTTPGQVWVLGVNNNFQIQNNGTSTGLGSGVPLFTATTSNAVGIGPSNSAPGSTLDITDKTATTGATRVNIGLGAADTVATTTYTNNGTSSSGRYATITNCSNSASPAVCSAAPDGAVAIPTGVNPTLVVNTTAVTANSRILLTSDDSLTIAATTCNSTLATLVGGLAVTARTAGTSFTVSYNGTITTNPLCISYKIEN